VGFSCGLLGLLGAASSLAACSDGPASSSNAFGSDASTSDDSSSDASSGGETPTSVRETNVDAGNTQIHIRIAGNDSDPVLLAINGGPGFASDPWKGPLDRLTKQGY